jgi:hypothetical protein
MFAAQPERRFVVATAIYNDQFRFSLYDRAGVIHTSPLVIQQEPLRFLRLMVGLFFADKMYLGYDPNFSTVRGQQMLAVNHIHYEVVKPIFVNEGIVGRGTVIWHVRAKQNDYIVKNVWTDVRRTPESTFLEALHEHGVSNGVPELIQNCVVMVDGQVDSTARHRPDKLANACRLHRMLVMRPLGIPIFHFASKRELLSGFIQVVEGTSSLLTSY